ncbi:hypothetical protein N781_05300 [Pontibacillus halophilus JSM 076056 = DSM 19796]|uniref:Type VII secretion protein EsaA n=1 Tax=Pontibacillus halophilus JSM 076056 = DSM 19796 TaxID=1385510 RepID=A0A0A5GD79_9BACI|nr:type VII secretion protein EsaA [Pontibacillus halophilus]KGX91176.1 hypothetical protein N781_05300 [Pontibacillus halophilus JSM 076056 = DSM 19796]
MTGKRGVAKLVILILIILSMPLLFFGTVGENPLKVTENATKTIAVVNEDAGTKDTASQIKFGEEITPLLEEQSNFEWTVVGRSAAENGLSNLRYDAIVYIPSDFSDKVMSYDDSQPTKTELAYTVQSQLNAANKERVLLAIEEGTQRVNGELSSLYWQYVSSDMENIRQEFDEILEKEEAFQQAMISFYQPSSKDLAGEIEEQRGLLSALQNSVEQASSTTPTGDSSMEALEQNLSNFVEYVEQYRTYQQNQQQLLAEIQSETVENISTVTENQQPRFSQLETFFEEQGTSFIDDMVNMQSETVQNQQLYQDLQQDRYTIVETQATQLYDYQSRMIDFYQQLQSTTTLNDLEKEVYTLNANLTDGDGEYLPSIPDPIEEREDKEEPTVPPSDGEDPPEDGQGDEGEDDPSDDNGASDGDGDPPGNENVPAPPDLAEEQAELISIIDELTSVQTLLTQFPDVTEDEITTLTETITQVNTRLDAVVQKLKEKESGENPLLDELEALQSRTKELNSNISTLKSEKSKLQSSNRLLIDEKSELEKIINELTKANDDLKEEIELVRDQNKELREELTMFSDELVDIVAKIDEKEQAILNSRALSKSRADRLAPFFSREITERNFNDVLEYFATLERYEATLNRMMNYGDIKQEVLKNEQFQDEVQSILSVTDEEGTQWSQLGDRLPNTEDALNSMEDSFTVFLAEYTTTMDESQQQLQTNLVAVQEDASNVLAQIQQPEQGMNGTTPTPPTGAEGTAVVSEQQQVSQYMADLQGSLESINETQDQVRSYTDDLQAKVTEVQSDANELNRQWSNNVDSTELIRDDVFAVLGNTFVDGQSNGQVYEFLANPLQISGSVPAEKEDKQVPPVVILVIIMLSSLMIGYATYSLKAAPYWIQGVVFLLLNLIVGFTISLFGLDIYALSSNDTIEWAVITILLLLVSAGLVRVAFLLNHMVGWLISVMLVAFYVTPLLALTTPNFNFEDPMSAVYISIQYGTNSLFNQALVVMGVLVIGLLLLDIWLNNRGETSSESEAYEA